MGRTAHFRGVNLTKNRRPPFQASVGALKLYDYAASANCYKVRLLLAQLGLDYERVQVDIFAGDTLTDEYAAKNPLRTTPVLETEDGYLPESNAILLYLAEGTSLLPGTAFERAQVLRWLIYEQTDVIPTMGGLRFRLLTGRLAAEDEDAVRRRHGGEEVLELLEEHLATREFFVGGKYTVADVGLFGYVHVAAEAGLDLTRHEHVCAWLGRVAGQRDYINDLEPYPPNAARGVGRSLYD
jgi:glutathione S-transferase